MGKLKNDIRVLYKSHGNALAQVAADEVYKAMHENNRNMAVADDMRMGMFVFMLYDLAGKSSRMEQYSPLLLVERRQVKTKHYVWGVSLNFIPQNIRIVFFDQLLERYSNVVKNNIAKDAVGKEKPLANLSFDGVYTILQSIGYEYALRQFEIPLINKMYEVSSGFLDRFLTFDTSRFTGVDEGKLMEIWVSKLKEQEERHRKMMMMLYNDYEKMADVLQKGILSASETSAALQKTAANLSKLG